MKLSEVREALLERFEELQDTGGPKGCYRSGSGKRPDLYSSCDVAIGRTIMGESLAATVPAAQREEWIDHINSFADSFTRDGSYSDTHGHAPLHANYMVVSALGVLGGRQAYPVRLYDPFAAVEDAAPWLERLDWAFQWRASHLFWGGMVYYSFSRLCSDEWRAAVFAWLDANIDPATGWWRRGIAHADRHQALGGGSHLWPFYQHHGRTFPAPRKVLDSILAMQLADGRWYQGEGPAMTYLDLDALYGLRTMSSQEPGHRRDELLAAARRYGALASEHWRAFRKRLLQMHPHQMVAVIGVFGLLQQLLPEEYPDDARWSDIFSDRRFLDVEAVEVTG